MTRVKLLQVAHILLSPTRDCSALSLVPVYLRHMYCVVLLQAGGEAELAMQMWWRAAALESLQAYVAGPLRKADPMEQANLARSVAALLQPTLAAVSAHPPLQVRSMTVRKRKCLCRPARHHTSGFISSSNMPHKLHRQFVPHLLVWRRCRRPADMPSQ